MSTNNHPVRKCERSWFIMPALTAPSSVFHQGILVFLGGDKGLKSSLITFLEWYNPELCELTKSFL